MKNTKPALSLLLVPALALGLLAGCGGADSSLDASGTAADGAAFNYSGGIDENGFWEGVTALDYVELFDYSAISIPAETHNISDAAVQEEIDTLVAGYTTDTQVTDRAVRDGDTVNIDYVGSVDGVEFDGGNTGGAGADVTIGVTNYIDDFLEQLIGHEPGETFNVEVTFPEDYGVDELNGQDAVFVTTVNHIVESTEPQLTDDFVQSNFSAENGWTNVAEMKEGVRGDLQNTAIQNYLHAYILGESKVETLPEGLMTYMENSLMDYYQGYAGYFGMEFDQFLETYMGAASADELLEQHHDENVEMANYYLVVQAIAEDAGITVSDDDVADYFSEQMGMDDYSEYEAQYGMPYLKQMTLHQMVTDTLTENAVLA